MFGIDMGPSQGETGATNALQGSSAFATSQGENLLGNSSAFINALLSGDTSKISQLLAPQISAIQGAGNQAKSTNAQFTTRGGGQASYGQTVDDKSRASVNDLVSGLTSGAIGEGASLGSNLLGAGMSGFENVFGQQQTMQQQRASKWNDIFKDVTSIAGGVIGGLPGAAGGWADTTSNMLGGLS